jgi:hypothetical protein
MTRRPVAVAWFGRDRRSHAALNRLARRLYHVCRNAADPFELAAQLESLGYNRYRVGREFGLRSTFELAEQLFAITPRRPRLARPQHSVTSPFWWQVAMLVALLLSLLLYQVLEVTPHYVMGAWLFLWTLGGTQFMRALEAADLNTKKRSFTLLLGLGLVGVLAVTGVPYFLRVLGFLDTAPALQTTLLHGAIALLWWQLPATFWASTVAPQHFAPQHFAPQQRLRHFVVSLLALFAFFIPPALSFALLFLASLLLFEPFLAWPKASTLSYLSSHWQFFAFAALLGLGQSVLLLYVMPSSQHPLLGLLLVIVTVLATNWLETSFKRSVATALWKAKTSEEFQRSVFQSFGFFLRLLFITLFLGLLVLLYLFWPHYAMALLPFSLLAFAFSLSFLLLGFNDLFLPATAFSIASLLVLSGFPFNSVVIALTAVLALCVVLYITKVERYGVDLL